MWCGAIGTGKCFTSSGIFLTVGSLFKTTATMSNDNITCQIKRSDRPCLVCSGHMDLIEARPRKFNLFSAIPLVCSTEGIDCLDCPKCGFTTTPTDYQYLRMCKNERQEISQNTTRTRKRRGSGHRRENSSSSFSNSNGRTCSSCQATLQSSSWQFCPACGSKCSASSSQSAVSPSPSSTGTPTETNEIILQTDSKNSIITDDDNSNDYNNHNEQPNSSNSYDSGIVRMVTPHNRASISNYDTPVQMQY